MSEENEVETSESCCCASCGIAEVDDVKLKECDCCDLVRYCSDECMEDHKPEHEEACTKRAAELRDELLFKQPESTHLGDCPICSLPLPLDIEKSVAMNCCSKVICDGCDCANQIREMEMRLTPSCPFCRDPAPDTDEEIDKLRMKRVAMNDPDALCQEGAKQSKKRKDGNAFKLFKKAAGLGNAEAHFNLACLYHNGEGVKKNGGKETYHLEEAALGGHPIARHILGNEEIDNGNVERAVKHWIIAATQGHDDSMKALMKAFKGGLIEKEDLTTTLRAHQAALNAMKSPQRKKAETYLPYIFG